MNESTFLFLPPLSWGNDLEQSWRNLANGPSRPPLFLLQVSMALSIIPTSPRPHNNLIKEFCEWSSWILYSGVDFFLFYRLYPQQTPCLPYSRSPVLAYVTSDIASKRLRRQSLGEDLDLSRFPKPHYWPSNWICQGQPASFQLSFV